MVQQSSYCCDRVLLNVVLQVVRLDIHLSEQNLYSLDGHFDPVRHKVHDVSLDSYLGRPGMKCIVR